MTSHPKYCNNSPSGIKFLTVTLGVVKNIMARSDYTASALLPHGHNQNWSLIQEIIKEVERVTSHWPSSEIQITVEGPRNLYGRYGSLIDAKIGLGDDHRDVAKVDIARSEAEDPDDDDGIYLAITLAKSPKSTSWVYAAGPSKRACEDLVRKLQEFILQAISYPRTPGASFMQGDIEGRLSHLHPAIKANALARLKSGHGDDAVEEACKSVGARLRQLSGLDDDGASLVAETLGKKRIIALNAGITKSEISEQDGYMHLGMALFRAARNPRAHKPADPNFMLDEVIEWLSVASSIHRALDRVHPVSTNFS
ncbi:TIGR02391 family protein [Streptosporangium sp. NPDC002721]|uniref:TIGR02391 family protein n=1 Tax=Streptosporangium sp. NPDC002721 TaxID=3366188 RepID=UPI0036A9BC18